MGNKIFELADRLKALRDEKKYAEDEVKRVNAAIDETDFALSELMAAEEVQNFTRDGSMFYLTVQTNASAVSGLKDDLYDAIRAEGHGDLITETIHARTLSSFVKDIIEENDDVIPEWIDGLINIHEKVKVGVRKATK
jgi:hypothetical protein